ncbi:hypothetical protein SAMN05216553_101526 [Lentzea fradiae]|uniref:DivIVA protein n=1 Tax=Lentzea fradiae TaxID=200378 RepID=A0A1G7KWC4_9PSEU|nr:hypothetical protein [Lentzea fradiae]SDF41538.1 hypothetical protein SAMN05216553_101526 [Lentzea fradiae]
MELLPLRTDFDVRWRGYDHDQVRHFVRQAEEELAVLAADRDAATARGDSLARQLEAARMENAELRARLDRICRTPVDPEALTERLRRQVELAHAEAEEITTRARAVAEQDWATARRAADRLRERADHLVTELDRRRAEMETEHRELMTRAHARVDTITRQAELRRRELDDEAARLREQVESDFKEAMTQRRREAMQALAERQRAAEARAEQTVRDATEHARRIVTEAAERVEVLRRERDRVAAELRAAQGLLSGIESLLKPLPDESVVTLDVIGQPEMPSRQEVRV